MTIRYVKTAANGGSDANPGTDVSPWLTLQYANDTATAEDTIIVGTGTYNEADASFSCFNPDKAMIWQTDGGIVTITSTSTAYVVLPQGTTAIITFDGFTFDTEGTTTQALYTATGHSNKAFTNCNFTGGGTNLWNNSGASDNITFEGCDFTGTYTGDTLESNIATDTVVNNCTFTTQSTMFAEPGNATTFTMTNCTGTWTPNATQPFIRLNGVFDLDFRNNNITVTGTSQSFFFAQATHTSGDVVIENNTLLATGILQSQAIRLLIGTHAISIKDNTITYSNASSIQTLIWLRDQPAPVIDGNILDASAAIGVDTIILIDSTGSDSSGAIIRNNILKHRKETASQALLVGSDSTTTADDNCDNVEIYNNTVYGCLEYGGTPNGCHGIEVGYQSGPKIYGNIVSGFHYGIVMKGGTGAGNLGHDYLGTSGAWNNLIIDCQSSAAVRIKGVENALFCNNTIIATRSVDANGLIHITTNADTAANEYSRGTIIKNNIVYATKVLRMVQVDALCLTSTYNAQNNLYYNSLETGWNMSFDGGSTSLTDLPSIQAALATASAVGQEDNTLIINPRLISIGTDYNLQAGSPSISAGIKWWTGANPVTLSDEPLADTYTDIGAYQSTLGSFHPRNL